MRVGERGARAQMTRSELAKARHGATTCAPEIRHRLAYPPHMADDQTLDQALAEILSLSARIDALELDEPKRIPLERRRDNLRADVRMAADASRSLPILQNELGALQRRLKQIDERPIDQGWAEKARYRGIRWMNDPGAYSNKINDMINSEDAAERAQIVTRIGEIETVLSPNSE